MRKLGRLPARRMARSLTVVGCPLLHAGERTVKDWPVEGTALHKRGTSAEEWEDAKAASPAPILDGSRGVPVSVSNQYFHC